MCVKVYWWNLDYLAAFRFFFLVLVNRVGFVGVILSCARVLVSLESVCFLFAWCKSVKINLLKNAITHLCIAFFSCSMGKIIAICCSLEVCVGVLVKSYCFNIEQASCSCRPGQSRLRALCLTILLVSVTGKECSLSDFDYLIFN